MALISFDTEASGESPVTADMVSVGFVTVNGEFQQGFYGECRPVNDYYVQGAYDAIGITRAQHEAFEMSQVELAHKIAEWVETVLGPGQHTLVSDNPAFDWQWISALFARAGIRNPFGHSARRIGDFAAGLSRDWRNTQKWKKLRITRHTHNAHDDAKGNAEALHELIERSKK